MFQIHYEYLKIESKLLPDLQQIIFDFSNITKTTHNKILIYYTTQPKIQHIKIKSENFYISLSPNLHN